LTQTTGKLNRKGRGSLSKAEGVGSIQPAEIKKSDGGGAGKKGEKKPWPMGPEYTKSVGGGGQDQCQGRKKYFGRKMVEKGKNGRNRL